MYVYVFLILLYTWKLVHIKVNFMKVLQRCLITNEILRILGAARSSINYFGPHPILGSIIISQQVIYLIK